MRATDFDLDDALRHEQVNYVGALYLLDAVLPTLLRQQSGHLSLVSSVAGFRGLPKALAYGPDQGRADQPGRDAVPRPAPTRASASRWSYPGFVETPLTAQNDFTHAGADQRRRGGAGT